MENDDNMKNNKDIEHLHGSGGGKGGGNARQPVEAENSLQSRSTAKLIFAPSEGEVGGLFGDDYDNPLAGIYFNDAPVMSIEGDPNFEGVSIDYRKGLPSQDKLSGFSYIEDFFLINQELEDYVDAIQTVSPTSDACRIILRLPNGLTQLDEESGDLNGYEVGYDIYVRLGNSGSWTKAVDRIIRGKTTSPYETAVRIERPSGSGSWQFRVRRTTESSESSRINDTIQLWAAVELQDRQETYDNAMVVGLGIDSQSTGGQIPTVSFLMDGIKILVPDNYHPTVFDEYGDVVEYAHYSGIWDGSSFKYERCDDPAWIIYNLLINERYGLGEYIGQDDIDHYSFYEASIYNVELIPAYVGADFSEPRFRFNGVIQTREEPYRVLQAIAGTCRSALYAGSGLIKLIQDRPQDPIANVTNSTVEDGFFNYTGSALEDRITSVNVTFNDIEDRYLTRVINEQADQSLIERYGYNQQDINAIGIVHESQARRLAKWMIDTSINSKEIVNFKLGWQNCLVDVGDVINVADNDYANVMFSGDIKSWSNNEIELDREINIQGGSKIILVSFDGREKEYSIQNSGLTDSITISGSIDSNTPQNAPFIIVGQVAARQFKITNVTDTGYGILECQATIHDPTKYDRVEQGIIIDGPPTFIGGDTIEAPENIDYDIETVITSSGQVRYRLRIKWDEVNDPNLSHYYLRYRRNAGQYSQSDKLLQPQFILDNALPGYYEIILNSVSVKNAMSPSREAAILIELGGEKSPLNSPKNLKLKEGGYTFNKRQFKAVWDPPSNDGDDAILSEYLISLIDDSNNTMEQFVTKDAEIQIDRDHIILATGNSDAERTVRMEVRAVDTLNRISDEVYQEFVNPAPPKLNILELEAVPAAYKIKFEESSDDDLEGYYVNHSKTNNFTPSKLNTAENGMGTSRVIGADEGDTYYVMVAAYDDWSDGHDELNWSNIQSVEIDYDPDAKDDPDDPQNLVVSSNVKTLINGTQVADINLTWNRLAAPGVLYDIEVLRNNNEYMRPVVSNPSSGSLVRWQMDGEIGIQYCFRVRSRDSSRTSDWSDQKCVTQNSDTSAPSIPSGLNIEPFYQGIYLGWNRPAQANFSHVEVYRRKFGGPESKIAEVARATSFFLDDGLDIGIDYYYRIRSVSFAGAKSNYSATVSARPNNVPDESITADHILARSITADRLQANTITANELSTNELITTNAQIGDAVISSANIEDYIQSDNFSSGSSGWRIRRDNGRAEFGEITARGNLVTGFGSGQRVEITADDDNYLIWAGSGSKTDSNGVFWIKPNGQGFISDQVFDLGGIHQESEKSEGEDAGQNYNDAKVVIGPFNHGQNRKNLRVDVTLTFRAGVMTSVPQNQCGQISPITGKFRLRRGSTPNAFGTVDEAEFVIPTTTTWFNDPDPSIGNRCYRSVNAQATATLNYAPSTSATTYYYEIDIDDFVSYFLDSQVQLNTLKVNALM